MLLISYDLNKQGQDYDKLIDTIKGLGAWACPMKSLWIIKGRSDVSNVFAILNKVTDENDYLLVTTFDKNLWSGRLSTDVINWLQS